MFDFIKQNPILCLMLFILVVSPSLFVGVFQAIAVVVVIVFVLIIIGVLLLRWKIYRLKKSANGSSANPYEQFFRAAQGATQRGRQGATEGAAGNHHSRKKGDPDVTVISSQKTKKVSDEVGEYVDFEEVEQSK